MKIENAIVCDEVRKEDNGKHLIIGVYPNDMLVARIPALVRVALWVQFQSAQDSETKFEFRIKDDDGKILISGGGAVPAGVLQPATITMPSASLKIEKKCILEFQIREKNKRWQTLKKIPVRIEP